MELKKHELSVLIPTYNEVCVGLVERLQKQAQLLGISYEIVVADDGSTDERTVSVNADGIGRLEHCRYIRRGVNAGRAAIRNYLASQSAYEWLLFVDSDMTVRSDDFLRRYMETEGADVVDGGVTIGGDEALLRHNLRYRYEKAAEGEHTAAQRQQRPYHHLHTANLMVRRQVMLDCPFDERFRCYGYEDVLLGKQLARRRVPISHIDNPLGFDTFEDNPHFVAKTEEGLRTLYQFRDELRGYSALLTVADGIHLGLVRAIIVAAFCLVGPLLRRNLCGRHPFVGLFKMYKLGYYLKLKQ